MIHITSQDCCHQYSGEKIITTWNSEIKEWVVNKEYEDAYNSRMIDWGGHGDDNSFPVGITRERYGELFYPGWDKPVNENKMTEQ